MNNIKERCENCKFCHTLYTPPDFCRKAKYEYCCTLFLDEGEVMWLGNDIYSLCECFIER